MELVIDKELLSIYFDSSVPRKKSDKEQKLILAIENDRSKIKISKEYLELLENYFSNISTDHNMLFTSFITNLSDVSRLISFNSSRSDLNELEILEEVLAYNYNDFTFFLTKSHVPKSRYQINQCVYDNISKPNKDWLLLSLSTSSVIKLDYSDFNEKNELENLFRLCVKLPFKDRKVHVIDSYFTLYPSSILNYLRNAGLAIKCYTSSASKSEDEMIVDRNRIKGFFGSKTSVKFSKNKSIIHERKIILGNLIVDSTHDFSEIRLNNSNWTIYLHICDEACKRDTDKLKKYA